VRHYDDCSVGASQLTKYGVARIDEAGIEVVAWEVGCDYPVSALLQSTADKVPAPPSVTTSVDEDDRRHRMSDRRTLFGR
jgi:hypothetical protein